LEFQAMTVSRSGAVRFATWDEIDMKARLWTIQPGRKASKIKPRSQGGRPHRVPLTPEMVARLEALPRFEGCNLVFPSPTGKDLSDATLGKVMETIHSADIRRGGLGYLDRDTGKPAVPHGLRASFSTWVSDHTDFERDMAEIALAHLVGTKVAQAYDRADRIEKRRGMMARWIEKLTTGK
ncbi:MAG: site-specific integrase, partial [Cypionkella sp.]|nr:site-specific integrase [Cypionkella sp.]